jgi:hypothetical protein
MATQLKSSRVKMDTKKIPSAATKVAARDGPTEGSVAEAGAVVVGVP